MKILWTGRRSVGWLATAPSLIEFKASGGAQLLITACLCPLHLLRRRRRASIAFPGLALCDPLDTAALTTRSASIEPLWVIGNCSGPGRDRDGPAHRTVSPKHRISYKVIATNVSTCRPELCTQINTVIKWHGPTWWWRSPSGAATR